MMLITLENIDMFYSDLKNGNEKSLYSYADDELFAKTMANDPENSPKIFSIVMKSNIDYFCKEFILEAFYEAIRPENKRHVLPSATMSIERFVEWYTEPTIEISPLQRISILFQDANYIKNTIFWDMVNSDRPDITSIRYVKCNDNCTNDDFYEKVTTLLIDRKDLYKDELSSFIEILQRCVHVKYFFEGEGFKYMKRIISMWSPDMINSEIRNLEYFISHDDDIVTSTNIIITGFRSVANEITM